MNKDAIVAAAKAKLLEAGISTDDVYVDDGIEPLAIDDTAAIVKVAGEGAPASGWWVKVEIYVDKEEVEP